MATLEEFSVREAVPSDALGIAEVHVATWKISYRGALPDTLLASLSVPPRAERWANMLATRVTTKQCVLVAETRDGRIVGFASAGPQGSAAGSEAGDPATTRRFSACTSCRRTNGWASASDCCVPSPSNSWMMEPGQRFSGAWQRVLPYPSTRWRAARG